jgi:NAD-dependent dihydropyrimidine dehydrogenase PreA subunit
MKKLAPRRRKATMSKHDEKTSMDIYGLLLEAGKKKNREKREQLLKSIDVKEFFEEGKISVDMKTCRGVECKLCIKFCPTNALYWKSSGEVGITEEVCIYCASCVLNCIVDNCIKVERKRPNGETETFSNPSDATKLLENVNTQKRKKTTESLLQDEEAYLKRYRKPMFQTEIEK